MTLFEETKSIIECLHQSVDDNIFIGSQVSGHACTWEEFCTLADFEYDNGYGGQEVATDLIIVFRDMTIMSRSEYDGSEWWKVRTPFRMGKDKKPITALTGATWCSLAELNKP